MKVEVDDSKVRLFDKTMGARLHAELLRAAHVQAIALQDHIVRDKLSGQVLNVRSGNLRRSIHNVVEDRGDQIIGRVYSDASVKYGGIHEYGGKISIPDIYPVKAQALHFFMGGKEIFAKHVRAHIVTMPERSFMRSALADRKEAIIEAFRAAVAKAVQAP